LLFLNFISGGLIAKAINPAQNTSATVRGKPKKTK